MGQHNSNTADMTLTVSHIDTKKSLTFNNKTESAVVWPRGAPRSISQVCREGPLYKEVSYRSINMATRAPQPAKGDPPKIRLYNTSTPVPNCNKQPRNISPRPSPIGRAGVADHTYEESLKTEKEKQRVNLLLRHYLRLDQAATGVAQWLKELRLTTENECPSILQAKTLTKDPDLLAAIASRNAYERVRTLQTTLDDLLTDFENLVETMLNANWSQFCESTTNFLRLLKEVLSQYKTPMLAPSQPEVTLTRHCHNLADSLRTSAFCKKEVKRKLSLVLTSLKDLIDFLTVQQITVIVGGLNSSHIRCLKTSLSVLTSIGRMGDSMCRLSSRAGAVEALLALAEKPTWCTAALRLCTLLCCVPEAVSRLESAGGFHKIASIICHQNGHQSEESAQSEAAGLLAQITTPSADNSSDVLRAFKSLNLDKLISSLTNLVRISTSSESLLLTSAALANLSFLEEQSGFLTNQTARHLIEACRKEGSLFVKDQVATVLANMAAKNAECVVSSGGLVQLLCFLQSRPSPLHSIHEMAACERLLQKSCVALARLCSSNPRCCSALADMKAHERLVRLCTDPKERNHSDAVLVAALTILRQVTPACNQSEIEKLGAKQLIEPTLWDSFLALCSNQETFV